MSPGASVPQAGFGDLVPANADSPAPAGVGSPQGSAPMNPGRMNRKKLWLWVAFLAFSPACVGVATWAALTWNGSYPTVAPPVPPGWQAVAGVYASFSVPKSWSFRQSLSDSQGDVYYSGPGGAAAQSVREVHTPPSPARSVPAVVAGYLGGGYTITSVTPYRLLHAARSWEYRFGLPAHKKGLGILAWAPQTSSEVWLIVVPASPTTERVLSTLTLAA